MFVTLELLVALFPLPGLYTRSIGHVKVSSLQFSAAVLGDD
jgi:hypothetical protein